MNPLPEFTVVRATTKSRRDGSDITRILVKLNGEWVPPGEETWWVETDEKLYAEWHAVEIVARPVDDD